jgi:hypothetical protein
VVVLVAFFTGVVAEPALLVSTRCNKNTPTITARPISAVPFATAVLAPRAKSPPFPGCRLMPPFCPLGA